jgi:hypothetical protein
MGATGIEEEEEKPTYLPSYPYLLKLFCDRASKTQYRRHFP